MKCSPGCDRRQAWCKDMPKSLRGSVRRGAWDSAWGHRLVSAPREAQTLEEAPPAGAGPRVPGELDQQGQGGGGCESTGPPTSPPVLSTRRSPPKARRQWFPSVPTTGEHRHPEGLEGVFLVPRASLSQWKSSGFTAFSPLASTNLKQFMKNRSPNTQTEQEKDK